MFLHIIFINTKYEKHTSLSYSTKNSIAIALIELHNQRCQRWYHNANTNIYRHANKHTTLSRWIQKYQIITVHKKVNIADLIVTREQKWRKIKLTPYIGVHVNFLKGFVKNPKKWNTHIRSWWRNQLTAHHSMRKICENDKRWGKILISKVGETLTFS